MERLEEFRFYYNHTIYPELLRMERQRLRLMRLLALAVVVLAGMIALQFYLNIMVVTLFMLIPHSLFILYLLYQIDRFRKSFKPNVVELLLDFIDNGTNFDSNFPMSYTPAGGISKQNFLDSGIFVAKIDAFNAEDTIRGRIGELDFVLSELRVRETAMVRNDLDVVFQGVFLHARFKAVVEGEIIVWPRSQRPYLTRAIKAFTAKGALNVDHEIMNDEFRELFLTYATPNTHVAGTLPETMQQAIVQYYHEVRKDIYFAFHEQNFFVAITEPKDLLEPHILWSNLSYGLVLEFMEDITLVLRIVHEFDQKI